jgi:adenylate cyclase
VFGDVVNIASRIQALADPESVCVTQQVYDQVQNNVSTPFAKLPPVALKNIKTEVSVYRVIPPWDARPTARPGPHRAEGGRSIAVLPLANISPDPGDEYFADGLTEELIAVLSQVRDLNVIARTSVMPYKTAPKSVTQVGADLGVDAVLEGSVRKAGKRIRITLQLIDVATQQHLWTATYNREIDDVFAVQSDIAERTAEALKLEFAKTVRPTVRGQPTANPAAYDAYLRGLVAESEEGTLNYDEAIRCYEQATELDPGFAEAYAAWGNLYVKAAGDYLPMKDVIPRARELTARALELEPDLSDAHAALANMAFQFEHDWRLAETEFRKAISLNPSNVNAHRFFAMMLIALDRFDEARQVIRGEIRLDPAGHAAHMLVMVDMAEGKYAAAIAEHEEHSAHDPSSVGKHVQLGFMYLAAGRREEALQQANTPLAGANEDERFDHALLNALLGRPEAARVLAAEVGRGQAKSYVSATHLAMLFSALGERDKALTLLEKDASEGDRVLWLWYRGTFFDPIRDDPRFVALLRQYGLPVHAPTAPKVDARDASTPGTTGPRRAKRKSRSPKESARGPGG